MEERNKVVYLWRVVETGYIFYIGSGGEHRPKECASNRRNEKFMEYVNNPNITCEMKIIKDNLTKNEAEDLEGQLQRVLIHFGHCNTCIKIVNSYRRPEDNPMYNRHHTIESREKMSKSRTGKKLSEEHCKHISEAMSGENSPMYGHSCTEFMTKEKIQQWKENKSKSMIGKNTGKRIVQLNLDGSFIREWDYVGQASKELKLNFSHICSCCKGHRNRVGDFKWMYLEDYKKLNK